MDAAYLQSTLGPLLSEGLAATLLRSPPDPIEFLAKWLRKSVEERGESAARERAQQEQQRDDAAATEREEQAKGEQERAQGSKQSAEQEREKQFQALLAQASSADALLAPFLQSLRSLSGASSAYVAQVVSDKSADGEVAPALKYVAATAENEWMVDKRLPAKQARVTMGLFGEDEEPAQEEEEEQMDEEGNPIPKAPKAPTLKSVFVPNTLLGPKAGALHFLKGVPAPGSYVAYRVRFKGCVSEESLDEAVEREAEIMALKAEQDAARAQAEKEAEEERRREAGEEAAADGEGGDEEEQEEDEEEEEDPAAARRARRATKTRASKPSAASDESKESDESEEAREARLEEEENAKHVAEEDFLLSQLNNRAWVEYALCLDTLGQPRGRRFSDAELKLIEQWGLALQSKLAALDRKEFTKELQRRRALHAFHKEVRDSNDAGNLRSEEEKAEEMERASEELEAADKPTTAEDVTFKYRTELLLSLKSHIAEWAESSVLQPRGPLVVLQAVCFLLGYDKEQVVDSSGRADWKRIRPLLTDSFFQRLAAYDPRSSSHDTVAADKKYTESVEVAKLIGLGAAAGGDDSGASGGVSYEEVKEKNIVLSELLLWARDALAVKRRAKAERAKLKREQAKAAAAAAAEEKRQAEEKRRAEEAAARAEAGEEEEKETGEGGAEEEEEAEEDE